MPERCHDNKYCRRDLWRRYVWLSFVVLFFVIGYSILLLTPHKKEEGSYVSFVNRMGNNARWWSKKQTTATLCQKREHQHVVRSTKENTTTCSGSCMSSKDFVVYEVSGVDYAALYDRIGSAIIIWMISLSADVCVILYHVKNRPHPKFMMTTSRLVSITIHAIAGSGECMAGLWSAFLVGDQRLAMINYMSVFSLFHILTAIFQTDIVFGAKKIMIPCYMCAIIMKIFCWVKLVTNLAAGGNELLILSWFLSLELIHHIYVWVRVVIHFTTKIGLFRRVQYTMAIIMAGMICVYPALGAGGMIFFGGFVVLYQPLWKCWVRQPKRRIFFEAELDRNHFFSDLYRERAVEMMKKIGKERQYNDNTTFSKELLKQSEDDLIKCSFEILDMDRSGYVTVEEIEHMLINWGCPESDAHHAMKVLGLAPETHVDVKMFKENFYDVWHFSVECLGELARHLDQKTVNFDGTLLPFQEINAHTIFSDNTDRFIAMQANNRAVKKDQVKPL
jgi:hypothetical protein